VFAWYDHAIVFCGVTMKIVVTLFRRGPLSRLIRCICIVAACCLTTHAQSDDAELVRARDEFISKTFTDCGNQNYYFGPYAKSPLECVIPNPTNRMDTARKVTACSGMVEYKGFAFASSITVQRPESAAVVMPLKPEGVLLLPPRSGEAGVALLLLHYQTYRLRVQVSSRSMESPNGSASTDWEPWSELEPNLIPATDFQVDDKGTVYHLPAGTSIFGVMIGGNGRWMFSPGPDFPAKTSLTDVLSRVGIIPAESSTIANGTRVFPLNFVSPQALTGGGIDRISAQKPKSCEAVPGVAEITPAQQAVFHSLDRAIEADETALQSAPKFQGSAEAFAQQLPGFVRQAASAKGLDPEKYSPEVAEIASIVQTCAKVTEAMADSVKDPYSGTPILARIGNKKEYAVCIFGRYFQLSPGSQSKVPSLNLILHTKAADDLRGGFREQALSQKERWGTGLSVIVSFNVPKTRPPDYVVNAMIDQAAH
jgi:hypothetical protein